MEKEKDYEDVNKSGIYMDIETKELLFRNFRDYNCNICHRLKPKEIRDLVYIACDKQNLTKKEKHDIFIKTLDIIMFIDKVSLYCCGKYKKSIVAGSIYISGLLLFKRKTCYYSEKSVLTQRKIAGNLKTTETSIRNNYRKILKVLKDNKYFGVFNNEDIQTI